MALAAPAHVQAGEEPLAPAPAAETSFNGPVRCGRILTDAAWQSACPSTTAVGGYEAVFVLRARTLITLNVRIQSACNNQFVYIRIPYYSPTLTVVGV